MKQFNRSNDFRKRDSPSGRKSGERRFERREPGRTSSSGSGFELTEVTCDKCGKKCDVPFKPKSNKPVYCRSCFRENSGSESDGRNDRFESRPSFDRESRGSFDRPQERFEQKSSSNISSEDFAKINRKLDKIMKALKIE
jgi:CxxC-x17-CxxC domain-containing protein